MVGGACRQEERFLQVGLDYSRSQEGVLSPRSTGDCSSFTMSPYQAGFQAYQAGDKLDDNPFLDQDNNHNDWDQGWLDAAATHRA
jgi:hypothetical protein